jgi:hypothetical protein
MCCGANRTVLPQTRASTRTGSEVRSAPAPSTVPRTNVAYFEYTGRTAMTVLGPISGLRYRFPSPGSRVAVDLRDRARLADIPNLSPVRSL